MVVDLLLLLRLYKSGNDPDIATKCIDSLHQGNLHM